MKGDITCCCVGVLVGVALIGAFIGTSFIWKSAEDFTELKQIHVVFCHGERTPTADEIDIFPLNINQNEVYYPHGFGALTNSGKMKVYKMGEALRRQYDTFLSRTYHQNDIIMQATDHDISKMSALLLLAGLWPVDEDQMWTDIKWQPIPYKNLEAKYDYMLFDQNCPRYTQEKMRVTQVYLESTLLPYNDLFQRLSIFTGHNISETSHVVQLLNLLTSQDEMKLPNPKWYQNMKKTLQDIVKLEHKIMFHNKLMRKLSSGALIHKIVTDSKKAINDVEGKQNTKVYMYSGYLNNIAALLAAAGASKLHRPEHGAAFLIEMHSRPAKNDYFYKTFYWDHSSGIIRPLELPGCEIDCPVNEFEKLMADIMIENYKEECKPLYNTVK